MQGEPSGQLPMSRIARADAVWPGPPARRRGGAVTPSVGENLPESSAGSARHPMHAPPPLPTAASRLAIALVATLVVWAGLGASARADAAPTAPAHRCAGPALEQAKALLVFHTGAAAEATVDEGVRLGAPLRNPVNRQQFFDVLRVQGHVYKADYQMSLIYARIPGTCVLMGQEIIEFSSP